MQCGNEKNHDLSRIATSILSKELKPKMDAYKEIKGHRESDCDAICLADPID
ncbi:Hypothetical protein PMT_2751 [Prochlorococcus marinus str. MIT 9313]|uniref:Uncharacterized protein n=1 Tax=Prochlorococcus marinus (strain MIT 9313) TaxID=74547 RepID=B9ESC8_PROMM|nr:Hypothetical protein PMT_2751 [Prochlorococcus marinus str. MIT 9313]